MGCMVAQQGGGVQGEREGRKDAHGQGTGTGRERGRETMATMEVTQKFCLKPQ